MSKKQTNDDKLLQSVVNAIEYTFEKDFLVKPMEPVKIKKKYVEQIPNGKRDDEGNNLYDTKETTKEVESDFEIGLILAIPTCYELTCEGVLNVGDKIVYPKKFAKEFDLFRDSKLIKPYDIVARCK